MLRKDTGCWLIVKTLAKSPYFSFLYISDKTFTSPAALRLSGITLSLAKWNVIFPTSCTNEKLIYCVKMSFPSVSSAVLGSSSKQTFFPAAVLSQCSPPSSMKPFLISISSPTSFASLKASRIARK